MRVTTMEGCETSRAALEWVRAVAIVVTWSALVGCAGGMSSSLGVAHEPSVSRVAADLDARSRGLTTEHRDTFHAVLAHHVAQDAYDCLPPVAEVLAPPSPGLRSRRIRGRMPHYGIYYGPMLYRIRPVANSVRSPDPSSSEVASRAPGRWIVEINVAISFDPSPDDVMELPDCELRPLLRGPARCEGIPYPDAPGVEACPDVGRFEAQASRHNARALLRRWSREVEGFYNRDADYFGIPVRYDFEFFLADEAAAARPPVDWRLPLLRTCARTPYFLALRTGWSVPVVAHEMAHFLGLLDEYEMLSGISSLYPKTPFAGAEQSRMGLSMKRDTRLLPLHHYLVLRRYHCREPLRRDPFADLL